APVDNLGTGIRNALIPSESTKLKQYRNVLLGLSVSETVLGTLSIALGIAVSVLGSGSRYVSSYIPSSSYYDYNSYNNYYSNYSGVGEGIWCGIWVLIAGSLGIAASRTKTKSCLIHCHMGFAITAAVFAASQVAASVLI
uniref:Uncharacterized protein n=1 Tax=Ciona savignyi TaxID=51511 RepID=H2YGU0_CIOSA